MAALEHVLHSAEQSYTLIAIIRDGWIFSGARHAGAPFSWKKLKAEVSPNIFRSFSALAIIKTPVNYV